MVTLEGIVSSMVTSFTEDGELNNTGLIENLQFQKQAGIKTVCVLGGTGEAVSLTQVERHEVMEVTMEHAKGLQVVFGALVGSPNEVKEDIKKATQLGADACMVMPPPFVRPSALDVERYMIELSHIGQPLMLFNTPSRSGFAMSTDLIARLSEIDNIIAIKESSGDLIQLQNIKQNTNLSFKVLTGGDINYLPSVILGADGGLLASAALFPELLLALEKAIQEKQLLFAQHLHYIVKSISDMIYKTSHPIPLKFAMELRGLPVGKARAPFSDIDQEHKEQIKKLMKNISTTLKEKVNFVQEYDF